MTDEEIKSALGSQPKPTETPMHTRPASEIVGVTDAHALTFARAKKLIDQDGWLHCWNCDVACDWHVSLHCTTCRVRSIYSAPERQREERRLEREKRDTEQEQSRPIQRVANRSFRDDY